jgi:hypothetical protein
MKSTALRKPAYDTVHHVKYQPAISQARLLAEQRTHFEQTARASPRLSLTHVLASFLHSLRAPISALHLIHAHLRGINTTVYMYEEATAMRPGEQILTAGILDLLPRERGVGRPRSIVCTTGLPSTLTRLLVLPMCARTYAAVLQGPRPIFPKRQTRRHGDRRSTALPCAATATTLQCYSPCLLTS